MRLNLASWSERYAALVGRYYEADAVAVIETRVKPGGVMLDVGGNLGFTALVGARRAGPAGTVIYVEPNGALVDRFTRTCRENAIDQVRIVHAALGPERGRVGLGSPGGHEINQVTPDGEIPQLTGDELLADIPAERPLFVKIDIEGYELRALAGLGDALKRPDAQFYVEVTDHWLRQFGGSAKALFALFADAGYRALKTRAMLTGVRYEPIDRPAPEPQYNVLFERP